MKKFAFALLLFLSACDNGEPTGVPPLSFRHFQPIYMKVSSIEVIEEYQSPMRAPNVEHIMPYSPADAMQIWVKQRLKASGGNKTMQVIIKDASVIDKPLPTEGGLTGLFKVQQNHEYNARLEVEMRIYGEGALSEASINVVGTRKLTTTEDLSAHERDLQFRQMLGEMMNTMNAELEKNMYQYLGGYIDHMKNP